MIARSDGGFYINSSGAIARFKPGVTGHDAAFWKAYDSPSDGYLSGFAYDAGTDRIFVSTALASSCVCSTAPICT